MALSVDYVVRETATNLRRNALMTLASILTVFLSLAMVGGALLLKQAVARATVRWRGGVELTIFMDPDASPSQSDAVERELSNMPEVKRVTFVDQDGAYKEFKEMFSNSPDLVGLSKKTENLPTELSGGEQQRVSIARAFVNRPLILLADEPTGNLDPNTTIGIMRLLDRINRTGTTVVMATHDHSIVDQMRRRVIELDRGTVVRDQARGVYGYGT